MNQYIRIEDIIINGIWHLMDMAKTVELQNQMGKLVERYNTYGYEFQESWTSTYWDIYNFLVSNKGIKTAPSTLHNKTEKEIAQKVKEVQDVALLLSASSEGTSNPPGQGQVLETYSYQNFVDKECFKYQNPTISTSTANIEPVENRLSRRDQPKRSMVTEGQTCCASGCQLL